jgi:uncharacterized UPF0160 family protein
MTEKVKVAITHDGVFHADDVFAATILKNLGFNIVRNRDNSLYEQLVNDPSTERVIKFDVGGVFDDENFFDHHQRSFEEHYPESEIKYSSCGLIWRKFGKEFIDKYKYFSETQLDEVYNAITEKLIKGIDAVDNGQLNAGCYTISHLISSLNVLWEQPQHFQETNFTIAMNTAIDILEREIRFHWSVCRAENEIEKNSYIYRDILVVTIADKSVPWQKHVIEKYPNINFVIFKDIFSNTWRIQSVPVKLGSFQSRKLLPEQLWGLSDIKLKNVTGLEEAIFCHANGFIAGAADINTLERMCYF